MQDLKYLELRKEDQFVGMNPDADGKPQHYHVWLKKSDVNYLINKGSLNIHDSQNRKILIRYNQMFHDSDDMGNFEPVCTPEGLEIKFFADTGTNELELAKYIRNLPAMSIKGTKSKLALMPYDFPEIDADYRMQALS